MLRLLRRAEVYAPSPLGTQDVLVAGGKIVAVAKSIDPPRGVPVNEVDLAGARLVPPFLEIGQDRFAQTASLVSVEPRAGSRAGEQWSQRE